MEKGKKIRIGILVKEKKFERLNLHEVVKLSNSQVEVVQINTTKPIDQQGHFDVILSKITDKLIDPKEKPWIDQFQKYLGSHPSVVHVDPISGQQATLDRDSMGRLFKQAEARADPSLNIHNPRHLFVQQQQPVYDTKGIQFPVVCKANVAGGSQAAHNMGLVFNEKGLHEFTPPFVAQEFYNHNNTIFKVFVIGDFYQVVKRRSIPNLPDNLKDNIFFDSQHPILPQLQKLGVKGIDEEGKFQENAEVPPASMKAMVNSLRETFGVSVFGFDVVTNAKTGKHGIIDINYFPGFIGVENFPTLLFNHLVAQAKKH